VNAPYLGKAIKEAGIEPERPSGAPSSQLDLRIDPKVVQEARQREHSSESVAHSLSLTQDPLAYQKTLDTSIKIGYRVGYLERHLEVDSVAKENGAAGFLTDKKRLELSKELDNLKKDLHSVTWYSPEAFHNDLSERASAARKAGRNQAIIDADEIKEKHSNGEGYISDEEEIKLRPKIGGPLKEATTNVLVKK
jgi:hypothetical protein